MKRGYLFSIFLIASLFIISGNSATLNKDSNMQNDIEPQISNQQKQLTNDKENGTILKTDNVSFDLNKSFPIHGTMSKASKVPYLSLFIL